MDTTERPQQMTLAECRDLLATGVVGRVAMVTPVGPRIVPMAYSVNGGAIVFRTAPDTELSFYGWDTVLAFEVDDLDHQAAGRGSSVVAVGRAHVVTGPEEIARVRAGWNSPPWAPGPRTVYVELVWRGLTGQRWGRAA